MKVFSWSITRLEWKLRDREVFKDEEVTDSSLSPFSEENNAITEW